MFQCYPASGLRSWYSLLSVSVLFLGGSESLVVPFWLLRLLLSWNSQNNPVKLSATKLNNKPTLIVSMWSFCHVHTSLGIGYSSDSSIRATWLILGRFSDIGSTHLKAVKSVLFKALVDGFVSRFGSITSSDRLCWTIIFSHSTKCT